MKEFIRGFPIMLQVSDFKSIKDKKTSILYQIVYEHLKHIESLNDKEGLIAYQNLFNAYVNGYTSNQKSFKNLLKVHKIFPYMHLDWLGVFIKSKLNYLENKRMKRLDDLLLYAEVQSTFGFLLLICDKLAKNHLHIITTLSKIDMLSYILLHDDILKEKELIHYPIQLIEDFGVEVDMHSKYLKNEQYMGLWEYLLFKINEMITIVEPQLIQFDTSEHDLTIFYIQKIKVLLKNKRDDFIHHLKRDTYV